jgi:HTH-type transcriptional regulator/antitoxin HigA
MIREFRNQYEPDEVTSPGVTLSDTIEALGMSQAELSERLGKAKKTINEIIKDKQRITPDTALDLERVLGVPASFWLNRQGRYDEFVARRAFRQHLLQERRSYREWMARVPYREMAKLGWIRDVRMGEELIRELLAFFGVASLDQWRARWSRPEVEFLKTKAFKEHAGVLAAWLRQGERLASAAEVSLYQPRAFRDALRRLREQWVRRPPEEFQPAIPRELALAGAVVLYVPHLSNLRVHGATRWIAERPVIQLSLRGRRDHYFWFTLFHEAYHILHHGRTRVFIESKDDFHQDRAAEDAANHFAEDTLIPRQQWKTFVQEIRAIPIRGIYDKESRIVHFSARMNVCPGVVVARLQHEDELPHNQCNHLKKPLADPSDKDGSTP